MSNILIGSSALWQLIGSPRKPKDTDLFVTTDEVYYRQEYTADVFSHADLDPYILSSGKASRVATLDELYTIKLSHSYWELKNGSWNKHIYDLRWMKRRGATLLPEFHDLLYKIWEQVHGKKKTNLSMMEDGTGEVWLPYPSAPEYQVSNLGQVVGPRGRQIGTTSTGSTKYRQFCVRGRTILGHKLVMETFAGPCPAGMIVRHLDGDGINNNLKNLAYGTVKENSEDTVRHGKNVRHEQHPLAKLTQEDTNNIRERYAARERSTSDGRAWSVSLKSLAEEYGVAYSLVWRIIQGQSWKEESPRGFFADAVPRTLLHDSLHYTVAYGERPMYEKVLKDGALVDVDSKKMWSLSHEDLVKLFREEVYATALERIVVPTDYRCSPGFAYRWALRRTVTSLTKGKSARFILENFEEFAVPDDYISRHKAKKDRLIRL